MLMAVPLVLMAVSLVLVAVSLVLWSWWWRRPEDCKAEDLVVTCAYDKKMSGSMYSHESERPNSEILKRRKGKERKE